jgi:hypothetical protein
MKGRSILVWVSVIGHYEEGYMVNQIAQQQPPEQTQGSIKDRHASIGASHSAWGLSAAITRWQ